MRYILLLILIFQTVLMSGQITDSEKRIIENNVKKLTEIKKAEFSKRKIHDKELAIDTFIIEETLRRRLDKDYSTLGTVDAMYDTEASYDILLNKYYKRLLEMLLISDKEKLKEAQRNWIKFRDSELALAGLLGKEEYGRGGTIDQIIYAEYKLELTKARLFQIQRLLNPKN